MSKTPPTVPICFTLTEALAIKASKLAASRYYVRFLLFAVIIALLVSAFFLFTGPNWSLGRSLVGASMIILGTLGVALILIGLMHTWIYPYFARKNFRQQKALSDEMGVSWSDTTMCYTAGRSRSEMPFANLHGYRASGDVLLLYVSDAIYYMIPVDAFNGAEAFSSFERRLEAAGLSKL
jgi:uncharacterized membrane protein (DUF485 family)